MRKLILFLAVALASLGLIGLMPSRAEAQYPRYYVGYRYPTYSYRPAYYRPVYPRYYGAYYPAYYPTYTSYYYVAPGYPPYSYAPTPVVVTPRPVVRGYVVYPGGYVWW